MTVKILKSQIPNGFEVAVAAFAKEMKDWRAQEKIATDHDNRKDIKPIDRYVHRKRPSASHLVESAVNENDEADYLIVDDGPTPQQLLRSKKDLLLVQTSEAEQQAILAIAPYSKQRLMSFREADIRKADKAFLDTLQKPGLIAKAASAVGITQPIDFAAAVEKQRPAQDTEFLATQAANRLKIEAIQRAAAQAHSDIEDLTLDNIDAWKMPDFTK
jgi:hypothetical protein